MSARRVLYRCDAGALDEIGTGHVVRGLILAQDLRARFGSEVVFAMRPTEWCERVEAAGFPVERLDGSADLGVQLVAAAEKHDSEVVVLDDLGRTGRNSCTRGPDCARACDELPNTIEVLQQQGRVVVALDDPFHAAACDISVNPAFPGTGAVHEGFDRSILPSDVGPEGFTLEAQRGGERDGVFASFGGHDPGGAVRAFLGAWEAAELELALTVAVGDGVLLEAQPGIELVRSADLNELLPRVRVAVTNGGTTMLIAASYGAAVLAVAQYEHQRDNALRLEAAGAAEYMGLAGEVDYDVLVRRVAELHQDRERAAAMGRAGRAQICGLGRGALVELVQVASKLAWDSDFFGFPVACLYPKRLTPGVLALADRLAVEAELGCLYFLTDPPTVAGDAGDHERARAAGFHEVDQRWTYRATPAAVSCPLGGDAGIRLGEPADADALAEIASDAYEASRYYFDRHFPRASCQRFYSDWIQKSLRGEFDHVVLVALDGARVAGYISCRAMSANLGRIGLVGIAPDARGQGLGQRLVAAALAWFESHDLVRVEVVTQGRNTPAQRLYERCGFELVKTELWYHKWYSV